MYKSNDVHLTPSPPPPPPVTLATFSLKNLIESRGPVECSRQDIWLLGLYWLSAANVHVLMNEQWCLVQHSTSLLWANWCLTFAQNPPCFVFNKASIKRLILICVCYFFVPALLYNNWLLHISHKVLWCCVIRTQALSSAELSQCSRNAYIFNARRPHVRK
jgi:hypothetical protein